MIIGKSKRELDKMRASGRLVGQVLAHLRTLVEPGITTMEVDRAAEKMIRDPVTVRKTDTVARAISLMSGGGFRRLPIVDDDDDTAVLLRDTSTRLMRSGAPSPPAAVSSLCTHAV